MKTWSILVSQVWLFALVFSGTARAGTYTTSTGAVFTQVDDADFGPAWQEPSVNGLPGNIWSTYQGEFDNNAIRPDDGTFTDDHGGWLIVESQATRACAKINGRLPTSADYRKLVSFLEIGGGNLLSANGKKDLQALFPGTENHWFWSAVTTGPNGQNHAQGFHGFSGFVDYYGRNRETPQAVRCVH